jgi:hypothetical protein
LKTRTLSVPQPILSIGCGAGDLARRAGSPAGAWLLRCHASARVGMIADAAGEIARATLLYNGTF